MVYIYKEARNSIYHFKHSNRSGSINELLLVKRKTSIHSLHICLRNLYNGLRIGKREMELPMNSRTTTKF